MGLWYLKDSRFELIAYSDADHVGCKDDCKSISGGLQLLGEKLVSWSSKNQDCTAMSTAKAEYVSLSACCAQVIWMRTQLLDYGYKYNRIPKYCDSKSAIAISCNPIQHSRTKHIDIWYHFIKGHVEKGTVELYFVGTEYQLADLFTKALPKERFEYLVHRIVPWIYLGQFWHTLKEDGSKYRLKFVLDRKELTPTLDDFRIIFQLPQATDNNREQFIVAPKFLEMVLFYINVLGFTLELRSPSNFKVTDLVQPWQTPCKMFSRYLTTRVTGFDQPPLQIIFTKPIVSHYITDFHEISRRARDKYHNLDDDMMVKNLFNLGKHKAELSKKSHDKLKAKQNVQKVKEHLIAEEIEKLVEGAENVENVEVDSSTFRKDDTQTVLGTRLDPKSDKESLKVEITAELQPVNINEEEEESTEDDYELKRREKGSM
ncbi:hypothetical protein Tco_0969324 [Tanacetum coccineum]